MRTRRTPDPVPAPVDDALSGRIETLRARWKALEVRRIRAEADAERAEAEHRRVREAAVAEFGTDDPDELDRLADEAAKEADVLLDEWEGAMDAVERELARLSEGGPA